MTYLSGKAKKRKKIIRYTLYGVVFIVLVVLWRPLRSVINPVIEPVFIAYGESKNYLSSIPNFISTYTTSHTTLVAYNKQLEVDIERLENEIAEKDAHINELQLAIGEVGTKDASTVMVLYSYAEDSTRVYSTLLLSKGFKDGVVVGDYVYVRGLQPVCIIKEVYTSTSLCGLLTADGVVTEGVTATASSTPITLTLTGRGGGIYLANVARDTPITVGEKVVLKSNQSMTLGTVTDVLHNNQDTSWRVFVTGAYNPVTSSIYYIFKK